MLWEDEVERAWLEYRGYLLFFHREMIFHTHTGRIVVWHFERRASKHLDMYDDDNDVATIYTIYLQLQRAISKSIIRSVSQ